MPDNRRVIRGDTLGAVLLLGFLVAAVFYPIVGYDFIDYDVPDQVLRNPDILRLTPENVKHILTSECIYSYYPVRTLSFVLDYQLWGLEPGGFKFTNCLIHFFNVLLLFWLARRLYRVDSEEATSFPTGWDLGAATVVAGVFAVHPVVVQPVTWVAGREELLMTLGALGCFHCHLQARRLGAAGGGGPGRWLFHGLAALGCLAACLSNAMGAVIPLVVTVWDVITLPRPRWRRIAWGTAALWVIGAATVVIKLRGSDRVVVPDPVGTLTAGRAMLVLSIYWLNLKTLFWPRYLMLGYPQFYPESFLQREVILGGLAGIVTLVLLWVVRRKKVALFGLIWFGLALGPSLQVVRLMQHNIHRADRLLYLPLAGLLVAAAMGVRPLWRVCRGRVAPVAVAGFGLLIILAVRSSGHVRTWKNSATMWRYNLSVYPDNPTALEGLAGQFSKRRQWREAIEYYERALAILPENPSILNNLAFDLAHCPDPQLRDCDRAVRLARRACELTRREEPRFLNNLALACNNLATEWQQQGDYAKARAYYEEALEADPDYERCLFNLAWLLATCPAADLRDPPRAVRLAEAAYRVVGRPFLNDLMIVAAAYAAAGQFEKAVGEIDKAIASAEAEDDPAMLAELRRQRLLYQNRKAFCLPEEEGP